MRYPRAFRPAGARLAWAVVGLICGGLAFGPRLGQAFDRLEAERELVALTNAARTSNERPSLRPHDGLVGVARSRSEDMATRDYFSHEIPPENVYFETLLDESGIPYRRAGENIARNSRLDAESTERAQAGFLSSPTHRANLLDPTFHEIGVGAWDRSDGMKYYTVLFMLAPGAARPAPPSLLLAQRSAAPPAGAPPALLGGLLSRARTAHAQQPSDDADEVPASARRVERADDVAPPISAAASVERGAVVAAGPASLGLLDGIITRVLKLFLSLT